MAIKLIAIDIDGTLLNTEKQMTRATVDALEAAAKAGIHVCISTGRPLTECREYTDRLPGMRYIVTCTGAQVMDMQTGTDIFRKALSAEELRMLYKIICRYGAIPDIFDEENRIHNRATDIDNAEFWGSLYEVVRTSHIPEADLDGYVENYQGITNKIHMFFHDLSKKPALWEELKKLPYEIMESDEDDLEIMPLGIDKGLGLQKLAEHLGLQPEEVMAIGDGGNDVGMFRYAGTAVAMKNAGSAAKAAADRISLYTNDEDGVAREVWVVLKGETT